MPTPHTSILFPHLSNTPSFSHTLTSIKRSALSIPHRLTSITTDSAFVTRMAAAYALPLIANERCGSWYIPPHLKHGSVYFKSTDGHAGQWAFSLRRLNLQLLDVVVECGGCVVVDSTRRGKSMPDALSKTVPFWCCVINRAVFHDRDDEVLRLFTPPGVVGESERVQMERRVDGAVRQFLEICKPDVAALRAKLGKPLRPLWVTQTSTLPPEVPEFLDFYPVVLCTASRRVQGAEASEGGYIQGAADDHEAWSHGLTPLLFWTHKDDLLRTNEEDLPVNIASLVRQDRGEDAVPTLIQPTETLHVSSSQNIDFTPFDVVISCTPSRLSQRALKDASVHAYLHLPCTHGKLGSRDLRLHLPALRALPTPSPTNPHPKILICCPTGRDLAVGTALAYLCLYANDDGPFTDIPRETRHIDKTFIKQRLSWITTSNPALNPSRATLQSVNSVLMSSDPGTTTLSIFKDPSQYDEEWDPLPVSSNTEVPSQDSVSTPSASQTNGADAQDLSTALFKALAKTWTFHRTIKSPDPSSCGTVTGRAIFTPSSPRALLYAETGTFTTSSGLEFPVRKEYVYRLETESTDAGTDGDTSTETTVEAKLDEEDEEKKQKEDQRITIHFADADASRTSSYFTELSSFTFVPQDLELEDEKAHEQEQQKEKEKDEYSSDQILHATNKTIHLCAQDTYAAHWRFSASMASPASASREPKNASDTDDRSTGDMWWEAVFEVHGPRKDYTSTTLYTVLE